MLFALVTIAINVRNIVRDGLHNVSSWTYGRLWDIHWGIEDFFNGMMAYVNWLNDTIPDWWGDMKGWIVGLATGVVYWLRGITMGIPDRGIALFNEHWRGDRGTWDWVAHVEDGLWWLEGIARLVGDWIDRAPQELYAVIYPVLDWLMEPIGWGIGEAAKILSGNPYSYWDYAKANNANRFDAIRATVTYLGWVINTRVNDVISWASSLPWLALDWVGDSTGEFQRLIAGSAYNPWDWLKANSPNAVDAYKRLWGMIADAVTNRLQAILNDAQAFAGNMVNAFRSEFWGWANNIQATINWLNTVSNDIDLFFRDPIGNIWRAIEDDIENRITKIILDRW